MNIKTLKQTEQNNKQPLFLKFEINKIRTKKRQEKLEDYEEKEREEKTATTGKEREGIGNPFI